MPTVTVIPPRIQGFAGNVVCATQLRRVAGYARVSTDSDEQFTSFEAQVDYYTKKIQENPEWTFVKVFTDEGISATNMKKRDGFNAMIAEALAGEIDLIVTKSVSRFARNTVDTLTTVRKLKDRGIEVYFEKENIYTLDAKGGASDYDYELACTGGKPIDQRKRSVGQTCQGSERARVPAIQTVSGVRKRAGWIAANSRQRSADGSLDL